MSIGLRLGLGLRSRRMGGGVAGSAFSPTVKGTNIVLSNGNRNASLSSGFGAVKGTQSHNSGQYYFEITILVAGSIGIGLADGQTTSPATLTNDLGFFADSIGWFGNNIFEQGAFTILSAPTSITYALDDVVGVNVNFGTQALTYYRNNVAAGGSSLVPAATPLFPAVSISSPAQVRIATAAPDLVYSPPGTSIAWG